MTPIVIGIVGGVASGKSEVSQIMHSLGAVVVDADVEGHAVLEDKEAKSELTAAFGREILDPEGKIDRKRLAQKAFTSDEARNRLNGITHPRIRQRCRNAINAAMEAAESPAVVLDISLLLEAGEEYRPDILVFVEAGEGLRASRAVGKRGWQEGELERRQAAQLSLDEKRKRADYVIENDGSLEDLRNRVEGFWRRHVASDRPG